MSETKWTKSDMPDLTDKVAIVTGGNSGLGYESVKAFFEKGAKVILACRTVEKGMQAKKKIFTEIGSNPDNIEVRKLDLGDLLSVKSFAESFQKDYSKIHILLNNAGIMSTPYGLTQDGFEQQMGVNHLGHFALTGLLFNTISNTAGARVVNVSSMAHKKGEMDFNNLLFNNGLEYDPWKAYRRSKLANLLFTFELQRRCELKKLPVISLAAHPGGSQTNLARHLESSFMFKVFMPLAKLIIQSAEDGALPQIRAATDTNAQGWEYYGPAGWREIKGHPVKVDPAAHALNQSDAEKLWTVSEKITGVNFPV